MIEIQPKELLDKLAVDEVAGRRIDLDAVHKRASRIRRGRVLGTALTGAGLAACIVLAFALATSASPHRQSEPAGRPSDTGTVRGITWTREAAPAWTPRAPESLPPRSGEVSPSEGPTPSPSSSPDESGWPGDRPAYRIPAAAGLKASEVPAKLILWEDTGPTLVRAHALGTMEMCEDPNTGFEHLGTPPVAGRVWRWTSRTGNLTQELAHYVTAFAPGTGHARFLDVRRNARPCLGSDRDLELLSGRAPGAELFILASSMTEFLPDGQFVVGVARVGDVVISLQLRVKATRADAVAMMEDLLPAAMGHLAAAHVPPPHGQWGTPTSS